MREDRDHIRALLLPLRSYQPLVMGIGNRLRGDDGVGPMICDLLAGRLSLPLVDAGTAPENHLGSIHRHDPDSILVLDAADLGEAPGSLALLDRDTLACRGCSTHTMSLQTLLSVAVPDRRIPLFLLGIQPAWVALGEKMSPAVCASAGRVAEVMTDLFGKDENTTQLPGS